jgi:glycosyltransferase involved in cell wall biosynthesis
MCGAFWAVGMRMQSKDADVPAHRLLVSAYGCEPDKGSEQGVGWNWCVQLARFAEVVVITRSNNRPAIEAALPPGLNSRLRFEYHDPPRFVSKFKNKDRGLYLYYLIWQLGAYRLARSLVRTHKPFDFVLHLTFGSIWMPTFMHRLGIPFIWGPLGGGEAVPLPLIRALPARGRFVQILRHFLIRSSWANPLLLGPVRKAAAVLVRTEDTARVIPPRYADKVHVVLETAIKEPLLRCSHSRRAVVADMPMRAIYTGRLVPFKNVAMALRAVANARKQGANVEFVIVGNGPLAPLLRKTAAELGIAGHVRFLGAISPEQVPHELSTSDVYLFPSLREAGVWSLMEAMAVGLPVICVNTSGMSVITDRESAIQLEPTSEDELERSMTEALLALYKEPELRERLARNAKQRIESKFRWEHKAEFMRTLLASLS